jgi:hypothetical protein
MNTAPQWLTSILLWFIHKSRFRSRTPLFINFINVCLVFFFSKLKICLATIFTIRRTSRFKTFTKYVEIKEDMTIIFIFTAVRIWNLVCLLLVLFIFQWVLYGWFLSHFIAHRWKLTQMLCFCLSTMTWSRIPIQSVVINFHFLDLRTRRECRVSCLSISVPRERILRTILLKEHAYEYKFINLFIKANKLHLTREGGYTSTPQRSSWHDA